MLRTIILFSIIFQQGSSLSITLINHALFSSININDLLTNLSNIETRDACICRCFGISNCIIGNYNGYRNECILFSAILQTDRLRVVPVNENATVVILDSRNQIELTTMPISSTNALSTYPTSTVQNDFCNVSTNPLHTYSTSPGSNYIREIFNYQALFTGTAILEFAFQSQNSNKVWHLDDVSIIDINSSNTEMLINGDFELGSLQYWHVACSNTNCRGTGSFIDQSNCHTGSYCYQGACRDAYDFLRQSFNVTHGHVYNLTYWIKATGNPQQAAYVSIYQR